MCHGPALIQFPQMILENLKTAGVQQAHNVGVVGLKDAEAVFDGEARGDDEEAARKKGVAERSMAPARSRAAAAAGR